MDKDENPSWDYKPGSGAAEEPADSVERNQKHHGTSEVSWEGPEFIYEHHGANWYTLLAISTALLAALMYLMTKEIFATAVVVVLGIIVGVFASQKPNEAKYEITRGKLKINDKVYNLSSYKSFTTAHEGALSSLNLFPLKKLLPPLSAYFNPQDEKKIIDAIGDYLPYEQRKLDAIDRVSRRLRL